MSGHGLVVPLLVCGGLGGAGGEPERAASPGRAFAVAYPTGAAWNAELPPSAQPLFAEHSAHLRRLRQQAQLLLGGRCGELGLIVLKAADLAEAKRLVESDPAVRGRLFAAEVHPWMTFMPGCLGEGP